jgi:hypothetical protein
VRIICGRLGDGHHHGIVEIEIGVSRLRLRPRRERAEDVVAEERHQVIAFGKDHQARGRSDPADNVGHGVGVTGERANAGRHLRHDRPHQWLSWRRDDRLRRCRRRGETSRAHSRQCTTEKCAPLDHAGPPAEAKSSEI